MQDNLYKRLCFKSGHSYGVIIDNFSDKYFILNLSNNKYMLAISNSVTYDEIHIKAFQEFYTFQEALKSY